jgi:hypothetical protein
MGIRIGLWAIEESLTLYETERLQRFLSLVEPQILKSREEWQKKIRQQAELIDDAQQRDEFLDLSSEEYWEFEEYERILRNSFLVTVYAFLEFRLGWFCSTVQKRRKLPISWKDLRGEDVVDRARLYLERLGGLKFPLESKEWQNIRRYEKLRHYIVHRGGRVPRDDKDTWTFAGKKQLIPTDRGIDQDGLLLTASFCSEVLDDVKSFFVTLHQELQRSLSVSRKPAS